MGTKGTRSSGSQFNPKGVTQGNTLVDPNTGQPIDVVTDSEGTRRLAVDANITAQVPQIQVELDYEEDSVSIGDPNTDTTLKINPNGSIDANVEIDAADGDNIAIVGTEDGTLTGTRHVAKIDALNDLSTYDNRVWTLMNTIRQSRAIDVAFDDIEVTAKNDDGNPTTVVVRYLGLPVRTLTLVYDADGDFQRIMKS